MDLRLRRLATVFVLSFIGLATVSMPAEAHRSGCHAAHSCPSDSGSYVCGDKGIATYCGGSVKPAPFVAPPDYDAPDLPRVSESASAKGGKASVKVAAESGSTIKIMSGGETVYSGVSRGAGQTVTFDALDGEHEYEITAEDSAGNTSEATTFTAVGDSVPPSTDGSDLVLGDASRPAVHLVAPSEDAVSYVALVDGSESATGEVGPAGVDVWIPVDDGHHTIELRLLDQAENEAHIQKAFDVGFPELKPDAKRATPSTTSGQEFVIQGAPGSRGMLKVAGKERSFSVKSDTTTVAVSLPDGRYPAPSLQMVDKFGRRGSATLAAFTIDTVRPRLRWRNGDDGTFVGKMAALILAEEGSRIAWRLVDADSIAAHGRFVATTADKRVVSDVPEGKYRFVVSATDAAGNVTSDSFPMTVAPDPATPGEIVGGLACIGLMLALFGWAGRTIWIRRDKIAAWNAARKHARAVRGAQREHDKAMAAHRLAVERHAQAVRQHEQAMDAWRQRGVRLQSFVDQARTYSGVVPTTALFKIKRTEQVFGEMSAKLYEERTRDNRPVLVLVESGRVTVTSLRMIFNGSKERTWEFAKLENIRLVDNDTYIFKVSNRARESGVECSDPELFKHYVDLALADLHGERDHVVAEAEKTASAHERAVPLGPGDPPQAPAKPALLLEAESKVTVSGGSHRRT